MLNRTIERLGCKVLADEPLSRDEAIHLAGVEEGGLFDVLYWAHRVRVDRFGDEVKLCSIGAGKVGGCSEDCRWCAQSSHYGTHIPADVEGADTAALCAAAREAADNGASSFGVVHSGRRPTDADLDAVEAFLGHLGDDGGVALCASLGELDQAAARRLAAIGIRRYNHNLETARQFFPQVVTTHRYESRLATLDAARAAGLSLCCGGIFGLGETWADRVDLALTLRDEVRPDVVPLNFLHPIPGTPLERAAPPSPRECLRIIAVFRLILPGVDLKVAGGRERNLRDLQSWMFYAGATSCLVGNYLTTSGRAADADRRMIADLGLTVVNRFSFERDAAPADV